MCFFSLSVALSIVLVVPASVAIEQAEKSLPQLAAALVPSRGDFLQHVDLATVSLVDARVSKSPRLASPHERILCRGAAAQGLSRRGSLRDCRRRYHPARLRRVSRLGTAELGAASRHRALADRF